MIRLSLLTAALVLLLSGCVTSRVEESRTATTGMKAGDALVILGRASYNDHETEKSFTKCIANALSSGRKPIRLVRGQKFKDELYPWFEPRTAPTSAKELGSLFKKPGVEDRIRKSHIRYLAWIDGDTRTTNKGGSLSCTISTIGGGCFGMSYWEQDANYEASIWDLQNLTAAGKISADANGTSYVAGLIIPIPIVARPGNAACHSLATQLKVFLKDDKETGDKAGA